MCVDCGSRKSTFLKPIKPIKSNNNFYKLQNMHIYCKKCKKHTRNTFPKKNQFQKKNIIKDKSKCAICLTEMTFIHEIEDKYDHESKVKVYPKFFTDQCYKRKLKLTA